MTTETTETPGLLDLIEAIPDRITRDIPESVIGAAGCTATFEVPRTTKCISWMQEYSRAVGQTGTQVAMSGSGKNQEFRVGMSIAYVMKPEAILIGKKVMREVLHSIQMGEDDVVKRDKLDMKNLPVQLETCLSSLAFEIVQEIVNAGEVAEDDSEDTS